MNKDEKLLDLVSKISRGEFLSYQDGSYCLSVAILLIKEYSEDRRRTSSLEMGYYLVLNYSLSCGDYTPLFDVSTNFGFYPISNFILGHGLVSRDSIANYFVESGLERFRNQDVVETYEQKRFREDLLESDSIDSCYIAPTSFGKSSMMVNLIDRVSSGIVFIIVPTKSLLVQTYKLINSSFPDRKVIFHDEMYDGEEDFLAIFTQERALRLLKKEDKMQVSSLLIDEAHNLFDSSHRSILLSRLIRRVRARDKMSRLFYFSPLISDSDNLKYEEQQNIETRRIQFNIKEAELFECRLDGGVYAYNRFLDHFFHLGDAGDPVSYVLDKQKDNNFVYLRAPRQVESFSSILADLLPVSESIELATLAETISRNVHEQFYCVDLVKKGVLYVHGKLPDLIKEYLEFKFKRLVDVKFIVANSVILEGVNLPIDNLYILNTYALDGKGLINLIGRVNRLNEVFGGDSPSLHKLRPSVHFVNTMEFNNGRSMYNKLRLLKPGKSKDVVNNPTLFNFDIDKVESNVERANSLSDQAKAEDRRRKIYSVIEREEFLVSHHDTDFDIKRSQFIEAGLHSAYSNYDEAFNIILKRVQGAMGDPSVLGYDVIDKVYNVFILGLEDKIIDFSFLRLKNAKARDFYRGFVYSIHALNLREHIDSTVKFFYSILSGKRNSIFYIGESYGEVDSEGGSVGPKNYIDLNFKSYKQLVNLALVKIKIESDFLSYKINDYVSVLNEFGVITQKDYDEFVYGTSKKSNSDLSKLGLSGALIKKIEKDGQIANINVDSMGHVSVNEEFIFYLEKQDDLMQFEINKYLDL